MGIQLKNISKRFGSFSALKDVSLEIKSGELLALLGPSGSGKTTLLRIIAGLEFPDEGSVLIDGEEAHLKDVQERHVGFVFQHYALFKHMSVFENVAFGLRVRPKETRPNPDQIRQRVMELLTLLHLDTFEHRYPMQLSGGQRQRVALARALAVEPKVLLLDEPFGALDAKVRRELRRWIRRLHDEIHITNVFVTHDQEEAMEVADRVAVLNNGRIEQIGTPEQVYHTPANSFVYDFLGNYNEMDGWKDANGVVHIVDVDQEHPPGKKVKVFARPHEMIIVKERDDKQYLSAAVMHINPAGSLVKLELERTDGSILQADVPREIVETLSLKKLDKVYLRPKNTRVFE
ncbi:MAG: sulfate ABC transporter ATP-binding protein [Chlamydiales bacterium]|nr:sulfate ABC transporter ATP-binding protein [Chlamydiales bacterium]